MDSLIVFLALAGALGLIAAAIVGIFTVVLDALVRYFQ